LEILKVVNLVDWLGFHLAVLMVHSKEPKLVSHSVYRMVHMKECKLVANLDLNLDFQKVRLKE